MSRLDFKVLHDYIGTGALKDYTFDFKIERLIDLLIIVLDDTPVEVKRVRGDDTVYLTGVDFDAEVGGGTVHLNTELPNNYRILILLANDAPIQKYQFREKGSFTLRDFENALDWILGPVQRLTWLVSKSLKLSEGHDTDVTPFSTELPFPTVADSTIITNLANDGMEYGPTRAYIVDAFTTAHLALQMIIDHLADPMDAHAGSAIGNIPFGNLAAINVQDALNELQADVDTRALQSDLLAHINDPTGAHLASAITNIPFGNVSSTDVQSAINELQADIDTRALDADLTAHLLDTTDSHPALSISVNPVGNLTANDVQEALEDLQTDIDALSPGGGLIASNVALTPVGNLSSTDVQAGLEELQGDIDALSGGSATVSGPFTATENASTPLAGVLTNSGVFTQVDYVTRVVRGPNIWHRQAFSVFFRGGAWELVESEDRWSSTAGSLPSGVSYTVHAVTGQITAVVDNNGEGDATITVQAINWAA